MDYCGRGIGIWEKCSVSIPWKKQSARNKNIVFEKKLSKTISAERSRYRFPGIMIKNDISRKFKISFSGNNDQKRYQPEV